MIGSTLKLLLSGLAMCVCNATSATVLDFDDVDSWVYVEPTGAYKNAFLSQYQGFNWSGSMGHSSWVVSTGDGIFAGDVTTSGNNYAFSNGSGTPVNGRPQIEITSVDGGVFDFNAFQARLGWFSEYSVVVSGYRNGDLVSEQELSLTDVYALYEIGLLGVDKITFYTDNGANILFDDIEVNRQSVPEPDSIALLCMGLFGMLMLRRIGLDRNVGLAV